MTSRPGWIALALVLAIAFCAPSTSAGAAEPTRTPVAGQRFVASLHLPPGPGPFPGVVLAGGSSGGIEWQEMMGARLAREGYAALALAYFGMEGLPKSLELIPLEYFQESIAWFRKQPQVDAGRIAFSGISKGGELALLIAAHEPSIRAVVAWVPGSAVFQSIAPGYPRTSSWSLGGEPLPFVPYMPIASREDPLAEMYRRSLEQKEAFERAAIPVERIQGPVLLLSGKQDNIWPSSQMSEQVVERLRAKGFAHPAEHVAYEDAGHGIHTIKPGMSRLGGSDAGNDRAQVAALAKMLEFLEQQLKARKPGESNLRE